MKALALGSLVNAAGSRSYAGGCGPGLGRRQSIIGRYVRGTADGPEPLGPGLCGFPILSPLGFSVNRGRPGSLLALLYLLLLALEDFHQCRRNIGVVEHHFPCPLFTPVDVCHPPINAYRLVSKLRLAIFSAQCVGNIVR
jgi:hypothetical protein